MPASLAGLGSLRNAYTRSNYLRSYLKCGRRSSNNDTYQIFQNARTAIMLVSPLKEHNWKVQIISLSGNQNVANKSGGWVDRGRRKTEKGKKDLLIREYYIFFFYLTSHTGKLIGTCLLTYGVGGLFSSTCNGYGSGHSAHAALLQRVCCVCDSMLR